MKENDSSTKHVHRERELRELRTKKLTKSQRHRFEESPLDCKQGETEGRDDIYDWDVALVAADSSEGEEENDRVGILKKTKKKTKQKPLSPTSTASSFTDFTTSSGKTIPIKNSASRIAEKKAKAKAKAKAKNSLLQISEEATDGAAPKSARKENSVSHRLNQIGSQDRDIVFTSFEESHHSHRAPDLLNKSIVKGVRKAMNNSHLPQSDEPLEILDEIRLEDPEVGFELKNKSNDSSTVASSSTGGGEAEEFTRIQRLRSDSKQSKQEVMEGMHQRKKKTRSERTSKNENWACRYLVAFVGLMVVVGAIACVIFFVVAPMLQESANATSDMERFESLKSLASTISGGGIIQDTESPQFRALEWLSNEDEAGYSVLVSPYREIVERYIIAVVYFSLSGSAWSQQYDFLTPKHTCAWNRYDEPNNDSFGVICNERGNVREIILTHNNLVGEIPNEVATLVSLEYLDLAGNFLVGEIPTELGLLKDLREIDFRSNRLDGSIPEELGQLKNLELLEMSSNRLTGAIPDIFTNFDGLKRLGLGDNLFTGSVPRSIGDLTKLSNLNLFHNKLEGDIANVLESIVKLEVLNLAANNFDGDFTQSFCGNEKSFDEFWADCRGDDAKVECSCCSICCRGHGDDLEC